MRSDIDSEVLTRQVPTWAGRDPSRVTFESGGNTLQLLDVDGTEGGTAEFARYDRALKDVKERLRARMENDATRRQQYEKSASATSAFADPRVDPDTIGVSVQRRDILTSLLGVFRQTERRLGPYAGVEAVALALERRFAARSTECSRWEQKVLQRRMCRARRSAAAEQRIVALDQRLAALLKRGGAGHVLGSAAQPGGGVDLEVFCASARSVADRIATTAATLAERTQQAAEREQVEIVRSFRVAVADSAASLRDLRAVHTSSAAQHTSTSRALSEQLSMAQVDLAAVQKRNTVLTQQLDALSVAVGVEKERKGDRLVALNVLKRDTKMLRDAAETLTERLAHAEARLRTAAVAALEFPRDATVHVAKGEGVHDNSVTATAAAEGGEMSDVEPSTEFADASPEELSVIVAERSRALDVLRGQIAARRSRVRQLRQSHATVLRRQQDLELLLKESLLDVRRCSARVGRLPENTDREEGGTKAVVTDSVALAVAGSAVPKANGKDLATAVVKASLFGQSASTSAQLDAADRVQLLEVYSSKERILRMLLSAMFPSRDHSYLLGGDSLKPQGGKGELMRAPSPV